MKRYLLDTNHLSNAIGKVSRLRDRIRQMRRQGLKFGTCWPALFELEMGMAQTRDPAACRRNLRILLKEVRIRPLDWDLMQAFGKVHLRLKEDAGLRQSSSPPQRRGPGALLCGQGARRLGPP
jgi:predicted nucleic acid-binding protein